MHLKKKFRNIDFEIQNKNIIIGIMITINNKIVKGQEGMPVSTLYVKSKADVPHLYVEISPQSSLKRTNKVYSNYSDAKDNEMSKFSENIYNARRWLKDNIAEWIPAGVSNCTLTATQWIDPGNPIRNAVSIYDNPNMYGYRKVSTGNVGDLLIARNPNDNTFHTMLITGFADKDGVYNFDGTNYKYKKGEPLLTYSRGGHDDSFIRRDIPLSVYTVNSDGKTENNYYTYNGYYKKKLQSGGIFGLNPINLPEKYYDRILSKFDYLPKSINKPIKKYVKQYIKNNRQIEREAELYIQGLNEILPIVGPAVGKLAEGISYQISPLISLIETIHDYNK